MDSSTELPAGLAPSPPPAGSMSPGTLQAASAVAAADGFGAGPALDAPPPVLDRERLQQLYKEALEEHDRFVSINQQLQKRLHQHFQSKKTEAAGGAEHVEVEKPTLTDQESRYQSLLEQLHQLQEDLRRVRAHYDAEELERRKRLAEREAKAAEVRESFVQFKRDLAFKIAENSRTGKPIPDKVIESFEEQELKQDRAVEAERLRYIALRNQLKKLETQLKKKEELKDGLHLIDFEQLKIENATFNEKIEDRNEEILKLRKKIHQTVLILTHVKEKLQFVQGENQQLKQQLSELEIAVVSQRDVLTRTKQERDALRTENIKLKQQSALIGADDLLRDYDEREQRIEAADAELAAMRTRYSSLKGRIKELSAAAPDAAGPAGHGPVPIASGSRARLVG